MQLHGDLVPLWDMAARVAVNGTILVVISDAGYTDMLENWVLAMVNLANQPIFSSPPHCISLNPIFNPCYTDMLENWVRHVSNAGLGAHFILFAEDEETLRFGQTRWPRQALSPSTSLPPAAFSTCSTSSPSGFNLLYSDTDVAILRNPLPEITADPKQTFDMAITLDGYESNWQKKAVQVESYGVAKLADRKLSVSSSLLFLRPTSGAKCLVGDWANRLMKLGRDEGTEQEHLNALIVEMDKFGLLPRIAVLPAQKFLSGQLLLEDDWATVEALKGELVTVACGRADGKDAKSTTETSTLSSSSSSSSVGAGDKGPFCVGLLCPEMHVSEEEVVLLSVQPWVPRHVEKMDALVPMVASADRFVIVTAACKVGVAATGAGGVGLLCPEMHVSEEEVVLLSVQPWVPRHLEKLDPLVPMVASAERFVIVSVACKGESMQCGSGSSSRGCPRHVQQMDPLVPMVASADRFVIVTAACKGQVPLFTNWFNAMHSAAMAGHVIASVPQEVEGTSEGLLRQPEESESDHKAALTCLLLPLLLMERVLKLGYNVIYSDILSVWLQNPLPFLPPEFNSALPSSVPSSTQPPLCLLPLPHAVTFPLGAGSGARERILSWLQVSCTSSAPQSASGSRSTEAGESADGGLRGVGGRGDEGLSERHVYGGDGYGGGRRCERVTKAGICVSDFFALVDDVYRPFWPGKVDLVIRSYLSEKLFLLYSLLTSVELMWPRGIGRVVVVLDEGDDVAMHLMPPWVQVKYERNYLKLPGKILQQWSYGWVDNYTSAPFVAIADDDIIFNLKVTPFLLFNLSDPSQGNQSPVGRPYLIGSKDQGYHRPSTDFLLGRRAYAGNFMVQLPLLLPRGAVSGYRDAVGAAHPKMAGGYDEAVQWWAEHGGQYRDAVGAAHPKMAGGYDEAVQWWAEHGGQYREVVGAAHLKMAGGYDEAVQWWALGGAWWEIQRCSGCGAPEDGRGYDEAVQWYAEHDGQYRDQIAHTVMGNYLWNNDKDKMEFAMEWSDHTPIPRVGIEFAMEWVDHTPIPRMEFAMEVERPQRPSREWACICPTHTDLFKDLGGGRRGGVAF
ncbi:unnamed protein product [Closterium sp. NIES-64]|nr:unnamed protein product [Closterium sp. NIES-64]